VDLNDLGQVVGVSSSAAVGAEQRISTTVGRLSVQVVKALATRMDMRFCGQTEV
jgi:hypothetical protein